MDGTSTPTVENCHDNSSFVSKLTLYWAGKRLLERNTNVDVLTEVPKKLRMSTLYLQYIKKDKERFQSLSQILVHMVKWKCLILSSVMLLETCFGTIIRAHFLGNFVSSFEINAEAHPNFWFNRYVSAAILIITVIVVAGVFPLINFHSEVLGTQLKITVTAIVYNKLLKIITPDMKKANVGHMINIFANDISKFEELTNSSPMAFSMQHWVLAKE
ncbi:hypothetical protein CHUAL_014204 [Chamberlinius hualienensis]